MKNGKRRRRREKSIRVLSLVCVEVRDALACGSSGRKRRSRKDYISISIGNLRRQTMRVVGGEIRKPQEMAGEAES